SEVCTELVVEYQQRFAGVEWKFAGEQSVLVLGDRELLRASGRQLMTNAVQAGASHVTLQVESDGDLQIRWDLIDDGSGIEEALAAKPFEPFASNRAGQAGLGLTIVARAVAAMNGKVKLSNRPSGGAVASVWIPHATANPAVIS